ncbi:uncharacterized protein LOC110887792 [Helianthus annuus]|uniref:uncharacterized protein LOC110887792 n=1 Tax=Helianthus annuus TaxID=4232 RepID=UPI000B8F2EF6|nr:uncharacterized protein LOC110887792 [Helianthus annuus]
MGYICEAMDRAKENIKNNFQGREEFYEAAFDIIDHRWQCQLHRPFHAAGHFLNPSIFYDDANRITKDEEVMSGLYACITRLSPIEHVEDLINDQLTQYQNADGIFGVPSTIRLRKKNGVVAIIWIVDPQLQDFVIRVLSLTCSATGCERNWGVFQHLHTKKRNRLTQERLNDMVYVKFNRAMERRHKKEGTADPILLEDIDGSNEWLMGTMEDEEHDDDLVFEGEDLTWSEAGRASGVHERVHMTRSSIRGKGDSSASTSRGNDRGKNTLYDEEEIEEDIGVRFGSLKWIKSSFGWFEDERDVCGRNKETKHITQGSTVIYGGIIMDVVGYFFAGISWNMLLRHVLNEEITVSGGHG